MSSSSSAPSWAVVSVAAGVGAGYVVGVLTAKWWQSRGRRSHAPDGEGPRPPAQSHADLVAALSDLTSQVGNLQTSLAEVLRRTARSRLRPLESVVSEFATESVLSELVSARGDNPESDDEFFDMEREEEEEEIEFVGSHRSIEYFDELGKATEQSEDVCRKLVKELKFQLIESPNSAHLLWRLSRALVHLSMHCDQQGKGDEEHELIAEATEHAQKALDLDATVWQSHQWYAIALGSRLKREGTQRKITAGFEYKEHIDTAISLNPTNPNLFYLRGRWEYEVAGLSWLEKKAAAALYTTPPNSTYMEALEDFMRVESFNGGGVWKANLVMVAKCHIKLGDTATAMDWLHKSLQLNVATSEDKTAHKEVEELIATYETE